MRRGEWLVSCLIVAFVAVKMAEAALRIDSWPLTTVPMFAGRAGPETVPLRMALVGRRAGTDVFLRAADFGLTDDELTRRVRSGTWNDAKAACSLLGDVYNRHHPPGLKLEALEARFTPILRPGLPSRTRDFIVPCEIPVAAR